MKEYVKGLTVEWKTSYKCPLTCAQAVWQAYAVQSTFLHFCWVQVLPCSWQRWTITYPMPRASHGLSCQYWLLTSSWIHQIAAPECDSWGLCPSYFTYVHCGSDPLHYTGCSVGLRTIKRFVAQPKIMHTGRFDQEPLHMLACMHHMFVWCISMIWVLQDNK